MRVMRRLDLFLLYNRVDWMEYNLRERGNGMKGMG
jgi:hypothetical protein